MAAPAIVHELVERFDRNRESYQSASYNEAQLRQEFLDPHFKALGWDVDNEQGHAEAYKDVIHEDAIKVGGATKAPDYCFRIGGRRVFFLEAKKPAVNVGDDVSSAFQLRRYAWSAKLPLSVLSNFAETAIYDCRIKPDKNDKASLGRVLFIKCEQLVEKWDEIAGIFSRDSVLKGSFDKFAESTKTKRGTAEVDAVFLEEIEAWRNLLARHLALRNVLSHRDLNFAVQRIIDRIIFLRMCEDRGIELYGQLSTLLSGENCFRRLCEIFDRADERYNSGLFHFQPERGRAEQPDELTPKLAIDDKPLKEILRGLYYPDSPYEFSVLPAEILGQVYEQFLGKVIRSTGKRAIVEDKPEVKKAGGVFYTPAYIVDYIVANTVGKLVAGRSPKQVAKLRAVDPACGSGSFLVGAFQFLLDWHRDWYVNDGVKKHTKEIYQGPGGQWQLATAEKRRILLNNIFGVDIDSQAVEVTKLALLLKVLEHENRDSLDRQLRMTHQRALPDLGNNIKCGNSLIGPDFYNGHQLSLLDDDEQYRINAFDWKAEFPEPFKGKDGGFDAVIGNPPWGADFGEDLKPYLTSRFGVNVGKYESYIFFAEQAARLLRSDGSFGFIIPSYWISRSQTEALRTLLFGNLWTSSLIILPENVFVGVKMDSCLITASRSRTENIHLAEVKKEELLEAPSAAALRAKCHVVKAAIWDQQPKLRFNPRILPADPPLFKKIASRSVPFGELAELTQGLTLYRRSTLVKRFGKTRAEQIVSRREFHAERKKNSTFKRELLGRDVSRYEVVWNGKSWVSYGSWLAHAVEQRFFEGPRLIIQKLRNPMLKQRLVVGYVDDSESYSAGVLLNAILRSPSDYKLFYIMGLLNSTLLNYWYRKLILDVSIRVVDLAAVPIRQIDFAAAADRREHDSMVELSSQMIGLKQRLRKARNPHERASLERLIKATDRRIDQLVYELYGLTDKEIALVEAT